jgi:hypothetical protein
MIANVNRDERKHAQPYGPEEFALRFEAPAEPSREETRKLFGLG